MRFRQAGFCLVLLVLQPPGAAARTIHVPADQPTIAAGLNHSISGDTVLVAGGTFYEFALELPAGVSLLSESGREFTTIDGSVGGSEWALLFIRGGGPLTRVRGFGFRNCWDAVVIIGGAPVIEDNSFTHDIIGCGVMLQGGGRPLVQNNIFVRIGSAVCAVDEGAFLVCVGNTMVDVGEAVLIGSPSYGAGAEVRQNLIVGGYCGIECAGYYCEENVVECNDVWGQSYCDYYGWSPLFDPLGRDGNFSAEPLFCGTDDHTLQSDSPCLPGQHPEGSDCGLIGAYGLGCGTTATVPATWGRLKATFIR